MKTLRWQYFLVNGFSLTATQAGSLDSSTTKPDAKCRWGR